MSNHPMLWWNVYDKWYGARLGAVADYNPTDALFRARKLWGSEVVIK